MSAERYAAIDVGTNSVLLLVAERKGSGFIPVIERAEVTRLGRGVDAARRLSEQSIEDTVAVLEKYAAEARALGARQIAVCATSAARDASNGQEFIAQARQRAGLEIEIISGELEAQLSFAAVFQDFAHLKRPLLVIDIGGGSTEFIYGKRDGAVDFRRSFDVGSVRLTERFIRSDPPKSGELQAIREHLEEVLRSLPPPPPEALVVGVAGTVTTLYALQHRMDPYDAERVQGGTLSLAELDTLAGRLCAMSVAQRRELPGLQPKRADVIAAGSLVLAESIRRLGVSSCVVSDRGLRWGMLTHRFGGR